MGVSRMTEQKMRRKIVNIIQDCLHENNQSIIFTTSIKTIYKEKHKFYTEAKFEVFIYFTDEKQIKILERTLKPYALKSRAIVQRKGVCTWHFFMTY